MVQRLKPVDVVTIGVGLTSSLAALELAKEGLKVGTRGQALHGLCCLDIAAICRPGVDESGDPDSEGALSAANPLIIAIPRSGSLKR
jgi:glycine/D-amino acid oxidase-like deaminating enzyme